MNPEVSLAAGPMSGMALVLMRFIDHIEALWRERRSEPFGNPCLNLHGT